MSKISYIVKKLGSLNGVKRAKEVKSVIKSAHNIIEHEICKINNEISELKKSKSFLQSDKKTQSKMVKELADRAHTEQRRLQWFLPLHRAALQDDDNTIITLLCDLFKAHQVDFSLLFNDLYSLAKVHRIVTGVVAYTPTDAHSNILAMVEYIADTQRDQLTARDFFSYYNKLKIDRHARRGADSGMTQTGKIFQTCRNLGIGYYTGSPSGTSARNCIFFVSKDSVLLKFLAQKPSQKRLAEFLAIQ